MQTYLMESIGVAAAVAAVYAAYAETMMPLRIAAIVANILAIVYGVWHGIYPLAALGLVLLALNAFRLYEIRKLVRGMNLAMAHDLTADWLLPFTRRQHFKAGQLMMARGDFATAAFYVIAGEAEIIELGESVGSGALLGEIGLFAPDGRRTLTVRCKTDVETARLDYDRFKELYFQNPQFGFRLLHLIVARLQHNGARAVIPT